MDVAVPGLAAESVHVVASRPWWANRLGLALVVGLGSVGVACALYGASKSNPAPGGLAMGSLIVGALIGLFMPLPTRVRSVAIHPDSIDVEHTRGEPVGIGAAEVLMLVQRRALSLDGADLLPPRALRAVTARGEFRAAFARMDAAIVFGLLADRCKGAIVVQANGAVHVPDALRGGDTREIVDLATSLIRDEYRRQLRLALVGATVAGAIALGIGAGVVAAFQTGQRNAGKGAIVAIVGAAVCVAMLMQAWRIKRRMGSAAQTIAAALTSGPSELMRAA